MNLVSLSSKWAPDSHTVMVTTAQASVEVSMRKPLYTVLFSTTSYEPESPTLPIASLGQVLASGSIGPHGLDPEVEPALQGIWYCLQLPKTAWDTVDLSLRGLRATLIEQRKHQVIVAPVQAFLDGTVRPFSDGPESALVVSPDDGFDEVVEEAERQGYLLPAARSSELSEATLAAHWTKLTEIWRLRLDQAVPGALFLDRPMSLPKLTAKSGSGIALRRLLRQLGGGEPDADSDGVAGLLHTRAIVEVMAKLEDQGKSADEAAHLFATRMEEAQKTLVAPFKLVLPGMAPKYLSELRAARKRFQKSPGSSESQHAGTKPISTADSENAETNAFALLLAHQAAGDESMSVLADSVPSTAFHALANLERHWGGTADPIKVWKLLDRLNTAAAPIWTDELMLAVSRSSTVQAMTNFPLGLLRFPGDTAPLSCRLPIAYSPLAPLTRALQHEVGLTSEVDFTGGFHVLVAECIPETDVVGRISRVSWSTAATIFDDPAHKSSMTRVEALSVRALRESIAKNEPDILVISAHGFLDRTHNMAGLVIGDEVTLGFDLGPMPPLVILSSCHSGPRGSGPVAVSDLLLREGAVAVLSTLVPVDVRHNSIFMMRVLLYMAEVLAGREEHHTFLEVWHRVQAGNVINDVLQGNALLNAWALDASYGQSVLTEFMTTRSTGNLRNSHVYQDTERVLLEIAADRGMESQIATWLRSPGYLPESAMYAVLGDPHQIHLRRR
jgi:CHAT domain